MKLILSSIKSRLKEDIDGWLYLNHTEGNQWKKVGDWLDDRVAIWLQNRKLILPIEKILTVWPFLKNKDV